MCSNKRTRIENKGSNLTKDTLADGNNVKKRGSRLHYNTNYCQLIGNSSANDILNQNDVRLLVC